MSHLLATLSPPPQQPNEEANLSPSFVGMSGRFYIRQRRADGNGHTQRLTVWPSVDDYDQRNRVPVSFCDAAEALPDFSHALKIYPESLTTTPPAYESDRDETDMGLTPRNRWKERFTQTRRRDAA